MANQKRTAAIICVAILVVGLVAWLAAPHGYSSCNVAYIQLRGDLATYIPSSEATSTGNASDQTASEDVTQSIRAAASDPSMKAIVLAVDSPGGDPVAGQEIESALKQVQVPTVALIRSQGDSAAYMAATGATAIFASVFSDVGDIGITQSYVDNARQNATNGLTYDQLSIGKYKDMFDPNKPLTPDERALAMKELQINYQDFVNIVAENRHMSTSTVLALADGSSLTGEEAVQDGLIDMLGNVDNVRTYLTQKLGHQAVICGIDSE